MRRALRTLTFVLICASLTAQPDPGVWKWYHDYAALTSELHRLEREHPDLVSLRSMGKSVRGRDIWLATVTSGGAPGAKREVLFTAGMHGGEVVAQEALLRYVKFLAESPDAKHILDACVTYVVPCVNPDGLEACKGERVWKRARRNANGVDLNRNFDWKWDKAGWANADSDAYRGAKAYSEPESRALRDFLNSKSISLYLDCHSGTDMGPYLITPKDSLDETLFDRMAKLVSNAGGYRRVKGAKAGEAFQWAYRKAMAARRADVVRPLAMILEVYSVGSVSLTSTRWWDRYNPPKDQLDATCEKVRRVLVALTLYTGR